MILVRRVNIVAVLEVMWGWCGRETSHTRYFRINPENHSGKRLIRLIGHQNFWVTNACPECVNSASDKGTPDAAWLAENLSHLAPDIVLVCGRVAQATFTDEMVSSAARVFKIPHPADRRWTRELIAQMAESLRIAQEVAP